MGYSFMIRSSAAGFYLSYGYIHSRSLKSPGYDHVARYIEHANHSIVGAAEKLA
jgi:hypothetical protein